MNNSSLHRSLSARHIRFIAIGTAIGTGLFYGSAGAIQSAGPSVLLTYAVCGVFVYLTMRALGEMAVRHPVAGSFSEYSTHYLGPFAGFLGGYSYVIQLMLTATADVTAFAIYMGNWLPQVHQWVWVVSAIMVLIGLNLISVKVFGELEFWFSLIKVVAIISMIVGGILILIFGLSNQGKSTVANLWLEGFFGHGLSGFLLSFTIAVFAFGGTEIVGVSAAEATDPQRQIPRAINAVPWRIVLFYILTLAVIMSLAPWTSIDGSTSPFVGIFQTLGIPFAADLLNLVVITAALSAANACIFGTTRMLFGLSEAGHAPAGLRHTRSNGVPWVTLVIATAILAAGAFLNFLLPGEAFTIVMSLTTFTILLTWTLIMLSHLSMRRRDRRKGKRQPTFALPFSPWTNILTIAFFGFVAVVLGVREDTRISLIAGIIWIAALGSVYLVIRRGKPHHEAPDWSDDPAPAAPSRPDDRST